MRKVLQLRKYVSFCAGWREPSNCHFAKSPWLPPLIRNGHAKKRWDRIGSVWKTFVFKLIVHYVKSINDKYASVWKFLRRKDETLPIATLPSLPDRNTTSYEHLKRPFWAAKTRHHLTLGGPGDQTLDTRSTFGVLLISLGYNGSN